MCRTILGTCVCMWWFAKMLCLCIEFLFYFIWSRLFSLKHTHTHTLTEICASDYEIALEHDVHTLSIRQTKKRVRKTYLHTYKHLNSKNFTLFYDFQKIKPPNEWDTNETSARITASLSARKRNVEREKQFFFQQTKKSNWKLSRVCHFWLFCQHTLKMKRKKKCRMIEAITTHRVLRNQTGKWMKQLKERWKRDRRKKRVFIFIYEPFITWTIADVPSAFVGMQE